MGCKFLSVLLALLISQAPVFAQSATKALGTINGLPVTQEEMLREMRQYRSAVVARFPRQVKAGKGDFWHTAEAGGVYPIALLRKMALDSLAKIKVQEQLLRERKLWPYASYQDFLQDLHQTNAARQQAAAAEQVSYGPVSYSEQVFFDYRFTNALIQLKQQLVEEKLIPVTEDDLARQFAKMQRTVYRDEAKYTLAAYTRQVKEAYIEEAYRNLVQQYTRKALVKVNQQAFAHISIR
ncbi:MAG: hypothetical protein ACO1NZ_17525 [Adhaeribacter sp.]